MEMIFINLDKSKTNEPYKFVLNFSQILDFRSSNRFYSSKLMYLLHVQKNKKTVQNE